MQDTSNWGKSFLFISLLYTPDKVWVSFCENMVDLKSRSPSQVVWSVKLHAAMKTLTQ